MESQRSDTHRFLIAGVVSSFLAAILLTIVSPAVSDGYTSLGLVLLLGWPFFVLAALAGGVTIAVIRACGHEHWITSGIVGAIIGCLDLVLLKLTLPRPDIPGLTALEPFAMCTGIGTICGIVFHVIALRLRPTAP
ncbi:hypothetical protein DLREEDagr8_07020 [Dongia sp. agr-C8]